MLPWSRDGGCDERSGGKSGAFRTVLQALSVKIREDTQKMTETLKNAVFTGEFAPQNARLQKYGLQFSGLLLAKR